MHIPLQPPNNLVAEAVAFGRDKSAQAIDQRTGLPQWDVHVVDPSDGPDEPPLRVRVPAEARPELPGGPPVPVTFTDLRFVRARYQPADADGVFGWFYADAVDFGA